MVDDLDNNGQLAGVWAATDEEHTANLNELPRGELEFDIGHDEELPVMTATTKASQQKFNDSVKSFICFSNPLPPTWE